MESFKLRRIKISDIQFGNNTMVENNILYINKDQVQFFV